jgi:hypothetical protein
MDITVKILDKRDFPSSDPKRIGKFDTVVTYQIDAFHTYLITLPKETFSDSALAEAIKKDIEERNKWVGKELKIS